MKKRFSVFLAGVLALSALIFAACDSNDSSSGPKDENFYDGTPITKVINGTLNDALKEAKGKVYWKIRGEFSVVSGNVEDSSILGAEEIEEIILEGDEDYGAELRGTGNGGVGVIKANSGATLIIKNMIVSDSSSPWRDTWEADALEFGGKLRFENCTFSDRILLKHDAEAEFVNCSFYSPDEKRYAVWVLDGSASFKNCSFTGRRGLKIHEESSFNADVGSVIVENCTFSDIAEKPGLSIGTIAIDPENTTVKFKDCTFTGCQDWDDAAGGSREGIDGFYETDTLTETFRFIVENTTIDGVDASTLTKEFNQHPVEE